jgi:hypothetical protein
MAYALPVKYYNSFLLKKLQKSGASTFDWPGLPWNPAVSAYDGSAFPAPGYPAFIVNATTTNNWYLEEARIKGGFNNTSVSFGVRAFIVEESGSQANNSSALIYSGVLNSATGFNATNVFSIGENITKGFNPADGSIQKLYAADTNVIVFQESKVNKILINKNTVYSGDQGAQESALTRVFGQIYPYAGAFGISKNPESFAVFGNRKYFVDQNQGLVLRLSNDGFTPISAYGMKDFFRDELAKVSTNYRPVLVQQSLSLIVDGDGNLTPPTLAGDKTCDFPFGATILLNGLPVEDTKNGGNVYLVGTSYSAPNTSFFFSEDNVQFWNPAPPLNATTVVTLTFETREIGRIFGGWDIHSSNYVVSLQLNNGATTSFGGVDTYCTVSFDEQSKGWTSRHSYRPQFIDSMRDKFYSTHQAGIWQHYDNITINNRTNYYGTRVGSTIEFVMNQNPSLTKNFLTICYEGSSGWGVDSFKSDFEGFNYNYFTTPVGGFIQNQDATNTVLSYLEGKYEINTPTNVGTAAVTPPFAHAGFDRKENRYVANLVNNSVAREGEVIFGADMSGIKGYYATVQLSTDTTTEVGGEKELFAACSQFVPSSY